MFSCGTRSKAVWKFQSLCNISLCSVALSELLSGCVLVNIWSMEHLYQWILFSIWHHWLLDRSPDVPFSHWCQCLTTPLEKIYTQRLSIPKIFQILGLYMNRGKTRSVWRLKSDVKALWTVISFSLAKISSLEPKAIEVLTELGVVCSS